MFEYRVEIYAVRQAEAEMNRMAADGWRVISVSPNIAMSHGIVVVFERKKITSARNNRNGARL